MTKQSTDSVQISLTADEAVVLFEFVRRFSDSDALTIVDQAEQRALWNLCCIFERGPLSTIAGDWPDLLQRARDRLRDEQWIFLTSTHHFTRRGGSGSG